MKYFILCMFACMAVCVHAQTVKVLDKTSLLPLSNAHLMKKGSSENFVTNASGIAELHGMQSGDTLIVSRLDYAVKTIAFSEIQDGEILLSQKSYELNEIVISASRNENEIAEVAQQISVINKNEIDFQNNATTADLLQQSGEVLVQKSQFGGGSPMMRGFEASRILMVVDGVRMNNAIYRAGHLQNIITMDQSLLDRVELAFGPGSLMYGSDALGGVVNFTTLNPNFSESDKPQTDVHAFVRYGTAAQEKTGHLDLNLGGNKFASLTSFTFSDYDDLRVGSNPNKDNMYGSFNFRPYYQDNINGVDTILANSDSTLQVKSGYFQTDLMQKLLFKQNDKVLHLLNVQYSTSSDIPRYDRLTDPDDDPGTLSQGDWYYGPQNRLLAAYDLSVTCQSKIYDNLHIVASYQDIQESRHSRGFGGSNLTHRVEDVTVLGLNTDLRKQVGKHQLNYGVEMYLNDVSSTAERENIETAEITPGSTRYPDGGSTMNNFGVYVSHIMKFGDDKWVLNDGIRFNASMLQASFTDTTFFPFPFSEIEQNNSAFTGSIGLIFTPDDSWRFSLIGSTGYRTPNVDDLAKVFDSEPGTVIVPNPDLKPEYTYNADLNISKVIADKVQVQATGFYTRFSNILTSVPSAFNGEDSILYDGVLSEVLTTVNASKAYLYGFHARVNADITDMISVTSALTYTYGRIETDSTPYPLDHVPPIYGRTGVNFQMSKLRAELYALYNGWKHIEDYNIIGGEDNEQYATVDGMPSWFTLNVKAAYQFTENLQLQAGCENILDLNYRVFASGVGAPGRNIFVTLRARI